MPEAATLRTTLEGKEKSAHVLHLEGGQKGETLFLCDKLAVSDGQTKCRRKSGLDAYVIELAGRIEVQNAEWQI